MSRDPFSLRTTHGVHPDRDLAIVGITIVTGHPDPGSVQTEKTYWLSVAAAARIATELKQASDLAIEDLRSFQLATKSVFDG